MFGTETLASMRREKDAGGNEGRGKRTWDVVSDRRREVIGNSLYTPARYARWRSGDVSPARGHLADRTFVSISARSLGR